MEIKERIPIMKRVNELKLDRQVNYLNNGRCDITEFYCETGNCDKCPISIDAEQLSAEELYSGGRR